MSNPVILDRLQVTDFRGIEQLELIRQPQETKRSVARRQWTLLLGDNGAGKTSLLWAIGLALIEEDLGKGVLAVLSPSLVRHSTKASSICVETGKTTYEVQVTNEQRRERLNGSSETCPFQVFGYGSTRGSAVGGPDRAVELDKQIDSVGTLFGLQTNLVHAETWLRNLEHGSLKDKSDRRQSIFNTVRSTILEILPGIDHLEVESDDIRVSGPAVGECSLSSLSDGYLTTLGWVVDLLARWAHEQEIHDIKLTTGFNKKMTGLVLIDELDLHLHPRWQVNIVTDLRRAFPKMSFVATTHNPLTLLGAEPGEVHVLRHVDGQLRIDQIDLPPGIRSDQVLTGAWFNLASTLDPETQKLLNKHRAMLRKRVSQSNPNRKKLERDSPEIDGILEDFREMGDSSYVHSGMVRAIFEQATGAAWSSL